MLEQFRIKEHMEVTDFNGNHVGTVDSVEDKRIKLTKSDSADSKHHYIDMDLVEKVDDNRAYLKQNAELPSGMGNKAQSGA